MSYPRLKTNNRIQSPHAHCNQSYLQDQMATATEMRTNQFLRRVAMCIAIYEENFQAYQQTSNEEPEEKLECFGVCVVCLTELYELLNDPASIEIIKTNENNNPAVRTMVEHANTFRMTQGEKYKKSIENNTLSDAQEIQELVKIMLKEMDAFARNHGFD